jgi:hypothetical protein
LCRQARYLYTINKRKRQMAANMYDVTDTRALKDGEYLITRTGSSTDVYRFFGEDAALLLSVQREYRRYNSNGQDSTVLRLVSTQGIDDEGKYQQIELRAPISTVLSTWGSGKTYYSETTLLARLLPPGNNAGLQVTFTSNRHANLRGRLEKVGDEFFINQLGCRFTVDQLASNSEYRRTSPAYGIRTTAEYEYHLDLMNEPLREEYAKFYNPALDDVSSKNIGKPDGLAKLMPKLLPFLDAEQSTLGKQAFLAAILASKRTVKGIKFSTVLNSIFADVNTQESFSAKLQEMAKVLFVSKEVGVYHSAELLWYYERLLNNDDNARVLQKASIQKKSTGAFNKIMDDLDFVKIDEAAYPVTHKAVHGGDLPLGIFFRKSGDSYFMYNDNWALWERMLTLHRDVAVDIAKEASKRTTFEKDIMSYFYFLLEALPNYLLQQTGEVWTTSPRLANSARELEPSTTEGTSKTRSALTPIADNDAKHVVVPYVSMVVSGARGSTYAYALDFNILTRGFTHKGNVVMKDVEERLNGRDDYGLMFYTLTGSAQGQGYPTFLMIFERLEASTRVHFHRTHPMRSKDGEYNPVHNWTVGCYKWMVGNVNYERILAQQGDLAFVAIDALPAGEPEMVNGYDSHLFTKPVKFVPYTKKDKQNVLGYVQLDETLELQHDEHLNRVVPAGAYEIRQCRSWEANPKGVWSLRID